MLLVLLYKTVFHLPINRQSPTPSKATFSFFYLLLYILLTEMIDSNSYAQILTKML